MIYGWYVTGIVTSAVLPDTSVARAVMVLIPSIRVPFCDREIVPPIFLQLPPLRLISNFRGGIPAYGDLHRGL